MDKELNSILLSLLTGVVSSLLSVMIVWIYVWIRDRRGCKRYAGFYDVYKIDGTKIDGEIVELSYIESRLLRAESTFDGEKYWESTIYISYQNRYYGEGVYRYNGKTDFGTHSVLVSENIKQIDVYYKNLSHGDRRRGGLIWKRRDM